MTSRVFFLSERHTEKPKVRSKRKTMMVAVVATFRHVRPHRPSSQPCHTVGGVRKRPRPAAKANRRRLPHDGITGHRQRRRRPTSSAAGQYFGASRTWATERPTCWACCRPRKKPRRPTTDTNTTPNSWRTFSVIWASIPKNTSEWCTLFSKCND